MDVKKTGFYFQEFLATDKTYIRGHMKNVETMFVKFIETAACW